MWLLQRRRSNMKLCLNTFDTQQGNLIGEKNDITNGTYTIMNDFPLILFFCHNHEYNSEKELTHTPTEIKRNEAVLSHPLKIVHQKAANIVCLEGHEHLRCAEYQCVLNFLLMEMFMKRTEKITLENIDDQEASAKQCLTYLGNWRQAHLNHRQAALCAGQYHKKQFLSPVTYNNLQITIIGISIMQDLF